LCYQKLLIRANNVLRNANNLIPLVSTIDEELGGFELLPVVGNLSANSDVWNFSTGAGEIYRINNNVLIPLSFERGSAVQAGLVATIPAGLRPSTTFTIPIRVVTFGPPGNIGPIVLEISSTGTLTIIGPFIAIPTGSVFNVTLSYVV
jgi:hypothetical protein